MLSKVIILSSFFISAFLIPITLQAQGSTSLKGALIDSTSENPLKFATVSLKSNHETVKITVTDTNGKFELKNLPIGTYLLTIMSVGYQPKTVPIALNSNITAVDLGKINIQKIENELEEVIVTGEKPLVTQDIDRLIYDVQADPESNTLSILELMRKVPMLSVDANDNLKLQGGGSYRIFIDNRPSAMLARNSSDVLKAMPASSIQKIEVITTPPAKYDSEGLAGIINIVTVKNIDNGYTGTVNLNYQVPAGGPRLGGNMTAKIGKVGISVFLGGNISDQPRTQNDFDRDALGGNPTSLEQRGLTDKKSIYPYIGTQLSYDLDSLNLFTVSFGINNERIDINLDQTTSVSTTAAQMIQAYTLSNTDKNVWDNYNTAFNYQRGFKRDKSQLLTFSYQFDGNSETQTNQLRIGERIDYDVPDFDQHNFLALDEHTVQIDYVHAINSLTIEGGAKGIFRLGNSDFRTTIFDGPSQTQMNDPAGMDAFTNDQYITSLYNSYRYQLKKWGIVAGVRAERTAIRANFISDQSAIDKAYFNVIPSIVLNKALASGQNLNVGYTQRVQRPGIRILNPFINRSNPNFEYAGNPGLRPVLSHRFNLQYSSFKKLSLSIALHHSYANNTIQQLLTYDGESGISRYTYANIGKDKNLGTNISINYPLSAKTNLNVNGTMDHTWIHGTVNGESTGNSGWVGNMYAGLGYQFDGGWRLNGNAGYSSPVISLQGKSHPSPVYSSVNASKGFMKDQLNLSVSVANPFNKYRNYIRDLSGPNFIQTSFSQSYYRAFSVNVMYRFGKLKKEVRTNRRGIKNDDLLMGK